MVIVENVSILLEARRSEEICKLQARFAIVRGPTRLLEEEEIGVIMRACVILHNMIVEDERDNTTSLHLTMTLLRALHLSR